jgi:hypothetical protein
MPRWRVGHGEEEAVTRLCQSHSREVKSSPAAFKKFVALPVRAATV